jgi:cytochrome c
MTVHAQPGGGSPPGDARAGEAAYARLCSACHSLDANQVGPRHRGVVGRRAGSVAGYAYSPALAASQAIWTAEQLDRWLANPEALIPGQVMGFRVGSPKTRADLIAYLAEQRETAK